MTHGEVAHGELAAARGVRDLVALSEVGEDGDAAVAGEAQPRAASLGVAPGENLGVVVPPVALAGGPREELVAVHRENDRTRRARGGDR